MPHMPDVIYKCPDCEDTNWVEIPRASFRMPNMAMPCRMCNPIRFRRWEDGHLHGDKLHGCRECVAIRAWEIHDFDYAPDGTLHPGVLVDR